MTIEEIENSLNIGQVPPPTLADYSDFLAVLSSSKMDRQDELADLYHDWFQINREKYKSDKATDNAWNLTDAGREQRRLDTLQKRITLLLRTIARHLRISELQARNLM